MKKYELKVIYEDMSVGKIIVSGFSENHVVSETLRNSEYIRNVISCTVKTNNL